MLSHRAYISRRQPLNFSGSKIESEMEEYSKITCTENVTIVRPVSSYAKITCEKSIVFSSYIDSYAKIKATGTATFNGQICDHVSIECKGEPIFALGIKIGSNVTVNGKKIQSTYQETSKKIVGVDGDLVVGPGGFASVSVCASIIPSTNALYRKLLEEGRQQDRLASAPKNPNIYSEEFQEYLLSFKDQPKNSDIIEEMKLTSKELHQFSSFDYDSSTKKIPNIPVYLHDKLYDLDTVLSFPNENGIRFNPDTLREFHLIDIEPAEVASDNIKATIKYIGIDREAAALKAKFKEEESTSSKKTCAMQ